MSRHTIVLRTDPIRTSVLVGLVWVCLLPWYTSPASAQTSGKIFLSADDLKRSNREITLLKNWKYHAGDNAEWADPKLDDSSWETVADTRLFPGQFPASGWEKIGWFRLHLSVDPALWNVPLALKMYHPGASEVYLNGERIYEFGNVGRSRGEEKAHLEQNVKVILFGAKTDHMIAVRYSSFSAETFNKLGLPVGFSVVLGDLNHSVEQRADHIRTFTDYQMFFAGVPIAFAILHLFLFLFNPRLRENLYYAIFTGSFAAFIFTNFQGRFLTDNPTQMGFNEAVRDLGRISEEILFVLRAWRVTVALTALSGTRFLYALFYSRLPRRFWAFLTGGVGLGIWAWYAPFAPWTYLNLFVLASVAEMLRIVVVATTQKKEGAWIISVGSLPLILGATYLILRNLNVIENIEGFSDVFYYGILAFLTSMSVYLSRNFARTEKNVERLEARTRRAQVEAALERVRAGALGMQKSEDISQAAAAVFQELGTLGFSLWRSGIGIVDEESETADLWVTTAKGARAKLRLSLSKHPVLRGLYEAWKRKETCHSFDLVPKRLVHYEVFFSYGFLYMSVPEPLSEEDLVIAQKFAEIFALAYARFLNLQRTEAQARQAVRQAAVDRVRAEALSMQKSEDIVQVLKALWTELRGLGMNFTLCSIDIFDAGKNTWSTQGLTYTALFDRVKISPTIRDAFEGVSYASTRATFEDVCWGKFGPLLRGQASVIWSDDTEEFRMKAIGHFRKVWKADVPDSFEAPRSGVGVAFSHGYVALQSEKPGNFSEQDAELLQEFAGAISVGYARFLDLQKVEAQARHAVRQAAVDRVRAEIATMQTSADLERITPLIWKELTDLGIPFFRCGVFIMDEGEKRVSVYLTNPHGTSLATLNLERDGHPFITPFINRVVDHWRAKKVYMEQWNQKTFLSYMQFLEGQGHIERERYLGAQTPPETLVLQFAPFVQGMLYVGSAAPLPEEDVDLIKDLANAFSVAYARYLDFQSLETQNRQLAKANREVQQANQAKSAFLANMSHELRTPLNSVIGMSDILMEKYFGDLTPKQVDYIKDIRESGQHLLSLINDILDLSKVEAGHSPLELSTVDLKPLLENSLTIVRERALKHGIALSCEVEDGLPEIVADERKVKQIVFNLLSNAVKFTPDGGRVGIRARLVHGQSETGKRRNGETERGERGGSPIPRLPASPALGWVEVVVVDTGIGIAPEDQEKVFGEFVQAEASLTKQYEGTGLGLALVKRFVEQHGGRVWLESEVGKGSRFYFTFPVEPKSETQSA